MKRIRLLDFVVSFLAGIVVGMVFAGVMLSPKFHQIKCDDGMSEQIEDGVRKTTYIPAQDTCKEKK